MSVLFGDEPVAKVRKRSEKPAWSDYRTVNWISCDQCVAELSPNIMVAGHTRRAKRKRSSLGEFSLYCYEHAEPIEAADKVAWPARVRGSGKK